MSIRKEVFELSLSTPLDFVGTCEILKSILIAQGVSARDIVEYKQDSRIGVLVFLDSLGKAQKLKDRFKGLGLKRINIKLTPLKRIEWQDKWKRDFLPFSLTPKIDVVPIWHKKEYKPTRNRQLIFIDTATAFGTGLHDTTRFMAQFIENQTGFFNRFLDIGTGTGILALVAVKSQAKEVWAIDIDKECIPVARSNMTLNECAFDYLKTMDLRDFPSQKKFDYVAANLISLDLIKMRKKIVSLVERKKFLAISGISVENLPLVIQHFKTLPLRCLKIKKSKNWAALLYQHV